MSETQIYHYVTHDDLISQKGLKGRLHLPHSMCNSAPSRLEHLDNLYTDDFDDRPTKSSSLVNLFPNHSSHKRNTFSSPEKMPVPSNSSVESDESDPPSPLEPNPLKFFSKINHDTNNNEENDVSDDCETISQASSTSLEAADSHRYSFGANCSGSRSPHASNNSNGFYSQAFSETINFGVPLVSAGRACNDATNDLVDNVDASQLSAQSIDADTASDHRHCGGEDDDDLESTSSVSSDDTFVGEEFLKDRPQVVYRSLSDSTVHKNFRKSASEETKRRKSVHFADSKGYDLEIHIPFSQSDDYSIPPKLMEALNKLRVENEPKDDIFLLRTRELSRKSIPQHILILNFQQPFLEPTFRQRVDQQNICLESVSILPNSLSFTGVIRVTNLDFEKEVFVRYTANMWISYIDVPAFYVSSLKDFQQDQFSFHLLASDTVISSGKIELAVCYRLPRLKWEFWDNNYSRNYEIKCIEHYG